MAVDGLESIDRTHRPCKLKVWCYQKSLLLRLLWPLQVFDITMPRIQQTQQCIKKYLLKWLGLPPASPQSGSKEMPEA